MITRGESLSPMCALFLDADWVLNDVCMSHTTYIKNKYVKEIIIIIIC